jgi:hypothetical protein
MSHWAEPQFFRRAGITASFTDLLMARFRGSNWRPIHIQ